jgi:hypothetical protein
MSLYLRINFRAWFRVTKQEFFNRLLIIEPYFLKGVKEPLITSPISAIDSI